MTLKKLFGRRLTGKFIGIIVGFIFIFSIGFLAGMNKTTIKPAGNKLTDTKSTEKTSTKDSSIANKTENNSSKPSTEQPKENKVISSTAPLDPNKKIAYLTFDDGPTRKITPKVLETLDKYNVKATFFVLGQMAKANPDLLKQERAKGHAICNHSYSHDYKLLYSSANNFLQDFEKSAQIIKSILGDYNGKVIRFPGGSYGSKRAPYKQVAKNAGYTYVDWNALNGDAEHQHVPADQLVARVQSSTKGKNHVVILMHDAATKSTTLEALPRVIEYLKSQGYSFATLDESGNIPANLPSVHGPNEKATEVSKPTKTK
ncbi:polysaccharide deacetylase [Clostridium botulinum]|uniref:polysaccharide deacetylase family protein n=1 Tax=Clostridium TaxID=1485 RepID=UPI0005D23C4B|nr:polysaccharide deacetylase [Clostridium haemolyticum]NFV46348.1 polysaccharide deacetylase [Clostridium botulinum]QPW56397.1 polysaccharide deacetylase [Clostridium botulinum]